MAKAKPDSPENTVARVSGRPSRPVMLRVRRNHGGGLWTLEDQAGQLYLAVRSPSFRPVDRDPEWATTDDIELMRSLGIGPA